ncbi:MAG TPA: hypothetical protein VGS21_03430 [Acidimicrobiales bacterium]|nr:hypothetical protein [Acidimicrobiales bacterium]
MAGDLVHALGGLFGLYTGRVVDGMAGLPAKIAAALPLAWLSALAGWMESSGRYLLAGLGRLIGETTGSQVGSAYFEHELGVMVIFGSIFAVPLLLLTAIHAVVHQDLGLLIRTVVMKLPLALVFTGVAVELVSLGLSLTDGLCGDILRSSTGGRPLFSGLTHALGPTGAKGAASGAVLGFVSLIGSGLVIIGTLVIWLELVFRSAAIEAATLFLPLALIGLVWPATSHWARRLGEILAALILSKLAVVAVLALGAGQLIDAGGGGFAAVISGVALLLLAAFTPLVVLRFVPIIDREVFSHLEYSSRAPLMAAAGVVTGGVGALGAGVGFARWALGRMTGNDGGGDSPIGMHRGGNSVWPPGGLGNGSDGLRSGGPGDGTNG